MATQHDITQQAQAWATFTAVRSRFNVPRKADEALAFSLQVGAHGFTIPTKLVGTSQFQDILARLADHGKPFVRLVARLRPDTRPGREQKKRVGFYWQGELLGFLQDKHLGWFLPLFKDGSMHGLEFFVLQVTGGEVDKPTRGVNIAIAGVGKAAILYLSYEQEPVTA